MLRLEGLRLVRTGSFRAPSGASKALPLDAAPNPAGGGSLVTAAFGEEVQSVDQGLDTWLHAFVLSAGPDGGLRAVSEDLGAWLRIVGGTAYLQRRSAGELFGGPVRELREESGRYLPGAGVPWGRRGLLEATPLPRGLDALTWDGERPVVVKLDGGERVPGGSIRGDLGSTGDPKIAIRIDRPPFRGIDREGLTKDTWKPLPRQVAVAASGGLYAVSRARSSSFFGRASGQDAVVRLDWSDGALSLSRPFPGVDTFVTDFALVERPGRPVVALLLVNEKEEGGGRAHLVFQEPRP